MLLKHRLIILIIFITACSNIAKAEFADIPTFKTDITKNEQYLKNNYTFKKEYFDAINKFENLNIKIAHEDFYRLIEQNSQNDFYLLILADKTAELGFFDLTNLACSKVKDLDISSYYIDNIKKFYFPNKTMKPSDIIMLAESYSNIEYNDQAKEAINDLKQIPNITKDNDYANYIIALGYYKQNNITEANKYIDIAINMNQQNINYKILSAMIKANEKGGKISYKILKDIKSQKIIIKPLTDKITATEQYIMYLTTTKNFYKDFYLAKYYYSKNDYNKANKILTTAISKNKKNNSKIYGLMSRCHFKLNNFNKANEYAQKAQKISRNNDSIITLGDIESKNGNYKNAIKLYKEVCSNKTYSKEALEKIAINYTKISSYKKANEIYEELLNKYNDSYIAYYKTATNERELKHLKQSLAINIYYQDTWIDLARYMIDKGNIELAKNYLAVANYLDDNNFRYYYYQSLLTQKELEINNIK